MRFLLTFAIFLVVLAACTASPSSETLQTQPVNATVSTQAPQANMPNPASVYCEQAGNRLEIQTAADGSQSGMCLFPDGSQCDEWAYYRGECSPASQSTPTSTPAVELLTPAFAQPEILTPMPVDPADYQGWWTYTHAAYGFSIMLPEDWTVDETTTSDPLMNGHLIMLHPEKEVENLSLRMTFRRAGEDTLLWPTGVGQGEFVPQGTLDIAGQPARRFLLICPDGQVNSIWFHGGKEDEANFQLGDLEFGFIYSYTGVYCAAGYSLEGKVQRLGEMIIASLKLP